MDFKDKLNEYVKFLNCTAKDLSEASGLSPATISRYRSGERIPEANSKNLIYLINGLVKIANNNNIDSITIESISEDFLKILKDNTVDFTNLQVNFNTLISVLSINLSELSRFLNYDASYISRIRNGKRQPAKPLEFATGIANFVIQHYQENPEKAIIADLIGCKVDDISNTDIYLTNLIKWLTSANAPSSDFLTEFLEKLDKFDLNEYISAIHFDKLKVPSSPFQFPTSKSYFGIKEIMESEISFLKATVLSKSMEPVIMYSDMPMGEMAKDPDFPKKWMLGMAMMLKKGLHLNQIHNIDRSFEDMMLGLESWIPLYMTGQVSPFYLKGVQNNVFSHFLKVSGTVALTGEAINGFHSEGKYYLTKNKEEVAYYKKRANRLLSRAYPLMEIYRENSKQSYQAFLQNDLKVNGKRRTLLSSLPLYTATDNLITKILNNNNISHEECIKIQHFTNMQREMVTNILYNHTILEEIPVLTEEDFHNFPMVLSLSGMFFEKDILYTWEEYKEHLKQTYEFASEHSNYEIIENHSPIFRNIQITIHEGKWVMVSKNKAPVIHFVIRHPKMRNAFENMIIPIIEE